MLDIAVVTEVDARDLDCPLPLLRAKQALNKVVSGDVIKVMATDSGSVRDFQAYARQSGHQLIEFRESNQCYYYWLRKA